jgi:hypothetical protein
LVERDEGASHLELRMMYDYPRIYETNRRVTHVAEFQMVWQEFAGFDRNA